MCACTGMCTHVCFCVLMHVVPFLSDTHNHSVKSINWGHYLWTPQALASYLHTRKKKKKKIPFAFWLHICRCCPSLNYSSTSFPNPLLSGTCGGRGKREIERERKQPDVSPVSSVIYKTPSTPHSSLMLYEKLKLNQGSVIKLSDFCWVRMNSCVCHIVGWKCAWGARGLRMHIHQLLVEMDLLGMGHWRFLVLGPCTVDRTLVPIALDALVPTNH